MSRPLRLEFAGAVYHVTSRGDRQEDIYDNDADRRHRKVGHVFQDPLLPLRELKHQVFLGSNGLIQELDALIDGDKDLSEVPNVQRRGRPRQLNEYEPMSR